MSIVCLSHIAIHNSQIDEQLEVTNKMVENYLRTFIGLLLNTLMWKSSNYEWSSITFKYLVIIKNDSTLSIVYGFPPPPLIPFEFDKTLKWIGNFAPG